MGSPTKSSLPAASRADWEPARHVTFIPAATGQQNVPLESQVVLSITAANLGASPANLKVYDGTNQLATIQVSANATSMPWPGYPGVQIGNLGISASAALDVSITNA